MSGFDIVKASFGSGFSGVVSGIVQFLIVVGYALLAGVILAIRENAVTYALATFAGASTALMHLSWFCVYIKALGFGLILNLVLFIGGTVFAMINLLLYKNELVANNSASAGYVPQQSYRQQPTYGQQPYNQTQAYTQQQPYYQQQAYAQQQPYNQPQAYAQKRPNNQPQVYAQQQPYNQPQMYTQQQAPGQQPPEQGFNRQAYEQQQNQATQQVYTGNNTPQ